MLPSGLEMKMPDEHLETLYKLLDLVSISSKIFSVVVRKKEIEALWLYLDTASVVTAAQLLLQKYFSVIERFHQEMLIYRKTPKNKYKCSSVN